MNAHHRTASMGVLRGTFFDGSLTDTVEDLLNAAIRAVLRRALEVINHLMPDPELLLVTSALCVANARSDCDRAGGLDLKWLMSKPDHFDKSPDRFMTTRSRPGIKTNDKHNAIPNLIANINHRLWTKRAPTTTV